MKILFQLICITFLVSFIGPTNKKEIVSNNITVPKTIDNIDGIYNIYTIKDGEMEFDICSGNQTEFDFYINANFFDVKGNPIGLAIINGETISKKINNTGGYFSCNDGIPSISIEKAPENSQNVAQTILWGIKDGNPNTALIGKRHGKDLRYRSIIGLNADNDILVIASNRIGLVTIEEIINVAISRGMVTGILLDGGSSVDYRFTGEDKCYEFSAFSSTVKKASGINEPPIYICGNFR